MRIKDYCPICGKVTEQKKKEGSPIARRICNNCDLGLISKKKPDTRSSIYMVEDDHMEIQFDILKKLESQDKDVLYFTREPPEKIKDNQGLNDTRLIWISETQHPSAIHPEDIDEIEENMIAFLKRGCDFLIMECLGYLFFNNSDDKVIEFLKTLERQVVGMRSSLVFVVSKSSLKREYKYLVSRAIELDEVSGWEDKRKVLKRVLAKDKFPSVKIRNINRSRERSDESRHKDKLESLRQLDCQYQKGEISTDEYISKRHEITYRYSHKVDSFGKKRKIEKEIR